jgi:hypothetical protein
MCAIIIKKEILIFSLTSINYTIGAFVRYVAIIIVVIIIVISSTLDGTKDIV